MMRSGYDHRFGCSASAELPRMNSSRFAVYVRLAGLLNQPIPHRPPLPLRLRSAYEWYPLLYAHTARNQFWMYFGSPSFIELRYAAVSLKTWFHFSIRMFTDAAMFAA